MRRHNFEEQFLDYLEGRLSVKDKERMEEALRSDTMLQGAFRRYKEVIELEGFIAREQHTTSSGFIVEVMDRITHQRRWWNCIIPKMTGWHRFAGSVAGIAVLVIVVKIAIDTPPSEYQISAVKEEGSYVPEQPLDPNGQDVASEFLLEDTQEWELSPPDPEPLQLLKKKEEAASSRPRRGEEGKVVREQRPPREKPAQVLLPEKREEATRGDYREEDYARRSMEGSRSDGKIRNRGISASDPSHQLREDTDLEGGSTRDFSSRGVSRQLPSRLGSLERSFPTLPSRAGFVVVYQASSFIPRGASITPSDVDAVYYPVGEAPAGAVLDPASFVGRITRVGIDSGEVVLYDYMDFGSE